MNITDSDCVSVAFLFQCAMRMRHTILPSVACLDIPNFFPLSHKKQDFQKSVIEHKMRFDFLYNFQITKTFFILRRTRRDIIDSHRFSCKVPVILVRPQ